MLFYLCIILLKTLVLRAICLLYAAGSLLGFKKKNVSFPFYQNVRAVLERQIFTLCHFNDLLIATCCLTCTLRPRQRRTRKRNRALRSVYLSRILLFMFGGFFSKIKK